VQALSSNPNPPKKKRQKNKRKFKRAYLKEVMGEKTLHIGITQS
jgi:hypothetical protein